MMASIRRIQSPVYHDRSSSSSSYHQNGGGSGGGGNPFSPSHKLVYGANYSSSLSIGLRRFVAGIFLQRYYSRKGNQAWIWSLYRFLLCFALGFLLGLTPFPDLDVDHLKHFQFNPPLPPPPHLKDLTSSATATENNIVFKTVNLGLETIIPFPPKKLIILVTPTYNRPLQAYYLTRLAHALRLVPPPLLWIVVEMNSASLETSQLLRKTGVMYRHLVCTTNSTNIKDRGVHQRNTALRHIAHHKLDGVVYFADDDNIYSLDLFQSLRQISRFGTWPVAMLAQSKNKAILEGPVCNGSQVIGWHTNEKSKRLRRFHVDMSGFAFNSTILWDPKRWNRTTRNPIRQLDTVKEGFQETSFIEQVVEDEFQMEGIPYGCSRIMNWHLHLDARNIVYPRGWLLQKNFDVVLPLD